MLRFGTKAQAPKIKDRPWGTVDPEEMQAYVVESAEPVKYECGLPGLNTGPNDPLLAACRKHDIYYIWHDARKTALNRGQVDLEFLDLALKLAGDNRALRLRAYTYYGIIRAVGWLPWKL